MQAFSGDSYDLDVAKWISNKSAFKMYLYDSVQQVLFVFLLKIMMKGRAKL